VDSVNDLKLKLQKFEEVLKKNGVTSAASLSQLDESEGVRFYPEVEQWGEYAQIAADLEDYSTLESLE